LPTVDALTKRLRARLPELSDINGVPRPEFPQIFDLLETHDPSVAKSYERFFEWIKLLLEVNGEPFKRIIETKISDSLIEAMSHLPFVIGGEIARLFISCGWENILRSN
jgi:hypothetical protein